MAIDLASELNRFLILLCLGVIGLTTVMTKMVAKIMGSFKPYRKATIIYLLVSLLFFALIAAASQIGAVAANPSSFFICCQGYFLLMGILHFYLMHQYIRWSGDEKAFPAELLFTVLIGLFGSIIFIVVYRLLASQRLELMMSSSIFFLVVPLFVYHTFRKALAIPPKIVKLWYYPVQDEFGEPDENKMKNLLVISFEFQKQTDDPHYTNFRARAPTDMELGQLFYYFINDYNERHPNARIQFSDKQGEPFGWIFYKKRNWHSFITQYIDTEKTVFLNKIRENDVIICSRSVK